MLFVSMQRDTFSVCIRYLFHAYILTVRLCVKNCLHFSWLLQIHVTQVTIINVCGCHPVPSILYWYPVHGVSYAGQISFPLSFSVSPAKCVTRVCWCDTVCYFLLFFFLYLCLVAFYQVCDKDVRWHDAVSSLPLSCCICLVSHQPGVWRGCSVAWHLMLFTFVVSWCLTKQVCNKCPLEDRVHTGFGGQNSTACFQGLSSTAPGF